jgi:hypothetical protein
VKFLPLTFFFELSPGWGDTEREELEAESLIVVRRLRGKAFGGIIGKNVVRIGEKGDIAERQISVKFSRVG